MYSMMRHVTLLNHRAQGNVHVTPVRRAAQASTTLTAVQERVAVLAAAVGALDAAPPALHRALDALHDTLAQRVADPPPDRASSPALLHMFQEF